MFPIKRGPSLKKILRFLDNYFEEILVIGLLLFLVFAVNIEVFRRYILNQSGAYSEEIARFALIWTIYLGVPYAIKMRRHIICDVIPARIPRRLDLIINFISYLCFLIFSIVMVVQGYELVISQIAVDKRTEAMHLPIWYFSIIIGIGFGLAVIRLLQSLRENIQEVLAPTGSGPRAWESEAQKGFD
jgi:TRAP-type C4-dicarboxylate transport system permease small subunit